MASELKAALPPAIVQAQKNMFGAEQELYFAPIRHHSPACALALSALLHEVRPAAILVEGPDDLQHLLPLLQHPQTVAPVAWLCQSTQERPAAKSQDLAREEESLGEDPTPAEEDIAVTPEPRPAPETRTAFFPFCDYSPEWVAIREGAALGAEIALIDMPWQDKAWMSSAAFDEDEDDLAGNSLSLMQERHFAHSRYLTAMARTLGCTDHHELWERLFELRPTAHLKDDWRGFFSDVLAWCAMARQDYEPEVLEAELSLPRERHMAAHILRWRQQIKGPIVVVTGGFHTLELLQSWQQAKPAKRAASSTKPTNASKTPKAKDSAAGGNAWLIRYSFEKLDALNGYSAGMPSPGYHQAIWERIQAQDATPHQSVALNTLTALARQMRAADHSDAASTALVQAAAVQAQRLAQLRGNNGPGRQDLLDAIRSCFIKGAIDDGTRGFNADVRRFLAGTKLGDIPPSAGSPPLIEDARRLARAAGVRLDDSSQRSVRLDLYRKPQHRLRSRFFHAMAYLDTGLAAWVTGPDFLGGSRLNLLFEEWNAAWTPLVEARLIELAADGASVQAVCLAKIEREEAALGEHGQARSASAAVSLLLRACLIGLQPQLPRLLQMLSDHLDEDASLASVVDCGHRLVTLWRAREPLGVQQHPQIAALLARTGPAALFLLPQLAQVGADGEAQAVQQLLSLRELGRMLTSVQAPGAEVATTLAIETANNTPAIGLDPELLAAHLLHFACTPGTACGVAGAASALLYLDGLWDDAALEATLQQRFGPGATPAEAVRFLSGLVAAAPELLLRLPALVKALDALVRSWDDEAFITYLPDLRQSFTQLRPQDTSTLAQRVAALHKQEGLENSSETDAEELLLSMHYETTEAELQHGLRLQQALGANLRRDGLKDWLKAAP